MWGLQENAAMYDRGAWPPDTRMRIYYDDSLALYPAWAPLLAKYRDHPFFQWVHFDMPAYKDPQDPRLHLQLIGTVMRFHAFFDHACRATVISAVDLDIVYKPRWLHEVRARLPLKAESSAAGSRKAATTKCNAVIFSNGVASPYYGALIRGIMDDPVRRYYVNAGLFSARYRFPEGEWDALPSAVFADPAFLRRLRYLDLLKVALWRESPDRLYEDFEYGFDEILLNYLVERKVAAGELRPCVVYLTSPKLNRPDFLRGRLMDYLRWNAAKRSRHLPALLAALRVPDVRALQARLERLPDTAALANAFRGAPGALDLLGRMQVDARLVEVLRGFPAHATSGTPPVDQAELSMLPPRPVTADNRRSSRKQ